MKKEEKWTPHIIAVIAFAVFIVLGLACASTASIPYDFIPEPKSIGISQARMDLNDPRMPPDIRLDGGYWSGTWAPRIAENQVSIFEDYNRGAFEQFNDIHIDGNLFVWSGMQRQYLYLAPGKHTVSFSYHTTTSVSTGIVDSEKVDINIPNVQMEIDMQPGKVYSILAGQPNETERSAMQRYIMGYRSAQFNLEFFVRETNWQPKTPSTAFLNSRIFLEPYDSSIPIFTQAFLETRDNIYIVGFNGIAVKWGWGMDSIVTIGVPPGNHTLQLVRLGDSTIYTTTVNCVSGSRYVFRFVNNRGITATNITRGGSISVTKTNETFNVADFLPTVPPATFDGPTITIVNDLGSNSVYQLRHLYISPNTDANWGSNIIKPDQVFRGRGDFRQEGDSISVQLPYPLSTTNLYDIMWIYNDGSRRIRRNIEITANSRILLSSLFSLM